MSTSRMPSRQRCVYLDELGQISSKIRWLLVLLVLITVVKVSLVSATI